MRHLTREADEGRLRELCQELLGPGSGGDHADDAQVLVRTRSPPPFFVEAFPFFSKIKAIFWFLFCLLIVGSLFDL